MNQSQRLDLLARRARVHEALDRSPYSLILYIESSCIYQSLGYPDLAAGAAYKALLLADAVQDESDEYHEPAIAALSSGADLSAWTKASSDSTDANLDLSAAASEDPEGDNILGLYPRGSTVDLPRYVGETVSPVMYVRLTKHLIGRYNGY